MKNKGISVELKRGNIEEQGVNRKTKQLILQLSPFSICRAPIVQYVCALLASLSLSLTSPLRLITIASSVIFNKKKKYRDFPTRPRPFPGPLPFFFLPYKSNPNSQPSAHDSNFCHITHKHD